MALCRRFSQICPPAIVHCYRINAVVKAQRGKMRADEMKERERTRLLREIGDQRRFFWSKLDSLTGTERRDAHRPSAPRRPAGSCSRRFQRRRRPARGGDRRVPGERGERRHRGNEKSERASESKSRKERKKVPSGSRLFLRHSSLSLSSPVFAVLGSRERKRRVSHGSSISMMLQENASRLL